MILFINVLLTENLHHGGHKAGAYYRGLLPNYNKVDIFKYSLASFAAIDKWSRIIINFELDEMYKDRQSELMDYILALFDGKNITVSNRRLFEQSSWQAAVEEIMDIPDQYVWFFCNHDHIFMDFNTDYLQSGINLMEISSKPYLSLYPTHLPELLSNCQPPTIEDKKRGFCEYDYPNLDSVQLVDKNLLYFWWFSKEYDHGFGRTDYLEGVNAISYTMYVPLYRELVRHFDGYHATGVCPALTIPDGFFENDIKIRYGYNARKPGWVQINPVYPNYSDVDPNGTDLKITIDRLPLFWRDRISDVDTAPNVNMDEHIEAAKAAFIKVAQCRTTINKVTDEYFSEFVY